MSCSAAGSGVYIGQAGARRAELADVTIVTPPIIVTDYGDDAWPSL